MAHELTPKADHAPLEVDEIIRRLHDSFAHVELDAERASRELEESVRYMARAGRPHFSHEDIERAQGMIGRSAHVTIADDPNSDFKYLSFILEPEHERSSSTMNRMNMKRLHASCAIGWREFSTTTWTWCERGLKQRPCLDQILGHQRMLTIPRG